MEVIQLWLSPGDDRFQSVILNAEVSRYALSQVLFQLFDCFWKVKVLLDHVSVGYCKPQWGDLP